jgi:hypothetical protein
MSLKTTHPQYAEEFNTWTAMRDFYKGEAKVKDAGVTYLPPTAGMVLDGMEPNNIGYKLYQAYKDRAVFPDYVKEGIESLIGLIHQRDAKIELPDRMKYLLEKATVDGESLMMLLRKINEEQLITGRLGLMVDLPENPDPANPEPFISIYVAESIRNWDDGANVVGLNTLSMVVLDESGMVRDGFTWNYKEKYRVLELREGLYEQGAFDGDSYVQDAMQIPMLRGKTLNKIPFVFINSKDLISTPDNPPLMGLGQLCLSIYRGEADYRQNLHMQGQDTLVTVGGIRNPNSVPGQDDDAVRVGAGSRIDVEMGGDAKFIGVSSTGLSEQRNSLENDRKRAEFKAGQLIGNQSLKNESGNAMLARLAAQTANLNQIALSSGEGLQTALRHIATWMGEDPEKVKVTPNTEFTNAASNAQELVYLMTARSLGAPLSMRSIHTSLKERGYTQMDYDDEMQLVKKEGPNQASQNQNEDPNDEDLSKNKNNQDGKTNSNQ